MTEPVEPLLDSGRYDCADSGGMEPLFCSSNVRLWWIIGLHLAMSGVPTGTAPLHLRRR